MLSARVPWYVVRPRNLYRRWWHRAVLLLFSWCLAMAVMADEKAKTIADVAGPKEILTVCVGISGKLTVCS